MKTLGERRSVDVVVSLDDLAGLILSHCGFDTLPDGVDPSDARQLPPDLAVTAAEVDGHNGMLRLVLESDRLPESCRWAGYRRWRRAGKKEQP